MENVVILASNKDNEDIRDWDGLLEDMLSIIISNLFLDDIKRIRLVCKSWSRIRPPSILSPMNFPIEAQSQWFMSIEGCDGTKAKFYHPLYKEPYIINDIPELIGASVRYSRHGWLLMSRGRNSIFFLNPFTKDLIILPKYEGLYVYPFNCMTFTSSPTSEDCLVIGFSFWFEKVAFISTISRGEEDWEIRNYLLDDPANSSTSLLPIQLTDVSPVFHNGKFYCLGIGGTMGVFCPEEEIWTVFENPKQLANYSAENDQHSCSYFFVESNGDLLSIFLGLNGSCVSVVKLDEGTMTWEKVESLGDHMLFLGRRTSLSVKKAIQGMQDCIYLPRTYVRKISTHIRAEEFMVFYSLAKETYKTFENIFPMEDGSKECFSGKDLQETGEPLQYTWIEPNFSVSSDEELNWLHISG